MINSTVITVIIWNYWSIIIISDNIIIRYPERFKGMKTARDYLADSDSIEDEIDRRQHIMDILTKEKDKSQSVVTQVSETD